MDFLNPGVVGKILSGTPYIVMNLRYFGFVGDLASGGVSDIASVHLGSL